MAVDEVDSVDAAREILIHNYLHILAIAFLFWDHIITLGDEIQYIWGRRPKTQSSYWFFLNRYFALLGNISVTVLGIFTTVNPKDLYPPLTSDLFSSCTQYNLYRQILLIVIQLLVSVLLTLRIYALYGCNVRILCSMIAGGMIVVGFGCWSLFGQNQLASEHGSGCHVGLRHETAVRLASPWEALVVYDSILFSMTLFKTYRARRPHETGTVTMPILSLMLRDGAIYFAVMALANLTNIVTFHLAGPFLRGGLSTFASSISVTMMSRLMLNLHESAKQGIFSSTAPTVRGDILFEEVDLVTHHTR